MQTIKPAKGFVFAKPHEAERKTQSGILLSGTAEKPLLATVINSSSSCYEHNDVVVYKSYTSNDIRLNNEDYIILDEKDILGTVLDIAQ